MRHRLALCGLSTANRSLVQICFTTSSTPHPECNALPSTDTAAIQAFDGGLSYLAGLLGVVPRTSAHEVEFSKIDYRINSHNTLAATYNRMRWASPAGAQSLPVEELGKASFGFDGVKVDMLTAHLNSILGNHIVSQLRYSWSRDFDTNCRRLPRPVNRWKPTVFLPPSRCPDLPSEPRPRCRAAPCLTNTTIRSLKP